MACDMDIQKCDGVVFFFLSSELHSGVNCIEAVIKVGDWVAWCSVAAEALAWGWLGYGTPAVVHIDFDVAWNCEVAVFGNLYGCVHGMDHPYLANCHHEGQANGTAILGGMVSVIVNEV